MALPAGSPGATPLGPTPALIGRDREQHLLLEHLAATRAGRGSLVLIGGEAGIGKTALAEALAAEAAGHGALVLVGRCYDLSETPPYGPWVEALERLPAEYEGPRLPAPLGEGEAAASQAALFARVREALAALSARQPLVLLLDDLQWADPASLDLLRALARLLDRLPVLALATYRADELTRRHPLYQLLPALVREARAARLDLRRLATDETRALVRARYRLPEGDEGRLVAYLHGHAEGNPFYAGELLRALEEERTLRPGDGGWTLGDLAAAGVPPLLRQVIDARLDRLGEAARGLLAVAAIVGQEIRLDVWAAVAEVAEEALLGLIERAAEVRVLEPTPEGARFAHALVREALYAGTLPVRRRALHRRAAEALLAAPTSARGSPDPDAVAYHLQRAGDPRAADWLVRAGERAQRAYAWLTAAARYEAALAFLEAHGGDPGERGWLLYRLGRLHRLTSPELGMRYLDAAASVARADRALAAWIAFDRGVMRCEAGDYRGGLADMAAGAAAFAAVPADERASIDAAKAAWLADIPPPEAPRPPGPPPAVALRPGVFALRLAVAGRYDEALAAGVAALAAARDGGPADALQLAAPADADFALGMAHAVRGRAEEARAALGRARRQIRALQHHLVVAAVALTELELVVVPYRADDPAARRALAAEGVEALARAGGLLDGRPQLHPQVPLLVLEGRWAEARARALASPGHYAKAWLGALALAQGDTVLAERLVREELPGGATTEPGGTALPTALALQRLAAALALAAGELPAARCWLAAHDRWLAWSGAVLGRAEGALGWAAYHRAAGDRAAARQQADTALAQATEPRQPLALLAAHRLLGELDTQVGRHADAAAHLDQALALAEACAAPYERALTVLALAELRVATGHHEEARALVDEARAVCTPLEARPALARADALAARLAAGPAPADVTARSLPAGLTAREAEVLGLVAQGLTDAQVAQRLYVSRHTVNAHLRSIYGKLGVRSRTAAARFATEHGFA